MTEQDWLSGQDPAQLLNHVGENASDRQLRLLCCGWLRSLLALAVGDPRKALDVIDVIEQFADGMAGEDRARGATLRIRAVGTHRALVSAATFSDFPRGEPDDSSGKNRIRAVTRVRDYTARTTARLRVRHISEQSGAYDSAHSEAVTAAVAEQVLLFRDIFGNPFPPITFDPSWRTEAVVGLARGMYEVRDFAPMLVLADALEDAGCASADVRSHCRGPGPHVRGCWVVDLVLGKN